MATPRQLAVIVLVPLAALLVGGARPKRPTPPPDRYECRVEDAAAGAEICTNARTGDVFRMWHRARADGGMP